jgi:L-amino acid N-acyltransferase YncA
MRGSMDKLVFTDLKSLSEDDLRNIVKIDNGIPSEFDSSWKPNDDDHAKRLKLYQEFPETDFFKAVICKNEIIGFYCIRATQIGSANIGMATTIWIHPSYRKDGIARQLFEMGIDWAKSKNIEFLQSSVHSNNERSMELHLKSGFETYAVTLRLKI